MYEVVIQCLDIFNEVIREMIAAEALLGIHRGEFHRRREYHHRAVLPTCRGFFPRPYWLRIRSNPTRRNYH